MRSSTRISPPNSLLFVSDPAGGTVPEFTPGKLILSTESCVSIGCHSEQDGATEVTLGKAQEVDPGSTPAFDDEMETPSRAIAIMTVEREKVLEASVPAIRTRVRIWVNHPIEPDKVIIGLG
jgi:hypothetical protein